MRSQLTDISVRSLKPIPGQQLKVWDTKTLGFGIRINGATKSWFVMYGKKRQLKVLGRYPELPLNEARRKALVLLGTQPSPSTAPSFPDALEAFLETHTPTISVRAAYEMKRLLRKHFHFTQPLDKITHRDIATAVDAIDAKSEASHALKDLRTFFNWCVPRYIPHSPANGIKPPIRYIPRSRILTDDELRAVWKASNDVPYPFNIISKLLLLTAQRKAEIGELKWSYISGDTVTLPTNKSGRPHAFPLSKAAQKLIASLPRTNSQYLFSNSRDDKKPYNGWGYHKALLDKFSEVRGATIHDWRRTVASNLQKLGVRLEVTEALLGHTSGSTGGIIRVYQTHDYAEEKREAVEKWNKKLHTLLLSR